MSIIKALESCGRFAFFAFRALVAALGSPRRPAELLRQFYLCLLGALPLGLVAGLALGLVVWIHLHGVVSKQLAESVPEYLALAVVVEFAPLAAAIVVAGRSGASLGAELGSMRLTEQIDALESMGLSPWRTLIGPRVLACMLTLPLLTVFIAFIAMAGSYAAEMSGGSLYSTRYQMALMRGLAQAKPVASTLKTVVFGYLVATTGCYFGMNTTGGTEGVGRAATQGVVVSTLLVLVANVGLVRMIQLLF